MASTITILPNGIHEEVRKQAGKTYTRYVYHFAGHQGYIAEAIRRTPETILIKNDWMGRGGSRHVWIELKRKDNDLLEQLKANYRAVLEEKKSARKRGAR